MNAKKIFKSIGEVTGALATGFVVGTVLVAESAAAVERNRRQPPRVDSYLVAAARDRLRAAEDRLEYERRFGSYWSQDRAAERVADARADYIRELSR